LQHALRILSGIGGFERPDRIEPARGLSNRAWFVTVAGEDYVLRVASRDAEQLGICRTSEGEVLRLAEQEGLGPAVAYNDVREGHLITRRIPAEPFSERPGKYREPDVLRSIVRAVRRVHVLPAMDHAFDPFARIRTSFERATSCRVPLPAEGSRILRRLDEIETARGPLVPPYRALCHNDLFAGNILDADPIRFVDWEFAGMGDVFFDLATLAVATDESVPLPQACRDAILDEYFGHVLPEHRRRLDDMVFVVRLHVVAWGLTHHVLGTPEHGWEGFTFLGFATELLEGLIAES
jgi:thiamine kinase-like enzyme